MIVLDYIFLGSTVLVLVLGLVVVWWKLGSKQATLRKQIERNLKIADSEKESKKKILEELAQLALGLELRSKYEEYEKKREELEDLVRSEKGRLTITQAELEAVDVRLRELEELKRELEVSNMDAVKELDMLRSQERDVGAKNEAIRNQLNESMEQIEMLVSRLADSGEVVEKLSAAKKELIELEEKITFYEEQISALNYNYMTLKKAYDALDIEYAQLYEKQQAADDFG